jgi:hypothetical protein
MWNRCSTIRRLLLFSYVALAAFTGVVSTFLLPFFILRAITSKDAFRMQLSLLFLLGFATQIVAAVSMLLSPHDNVPSRLSLSYLPNFPKALIHDLLYVVSSQGSWTITAGGGLLLIFIVTGLKNYWLVGQALLVAILCDLLSLKMIGGGRYAFLPAMIFIVIALQGAGFRSKKIAYASLMLMFISLGTKWNNYFDNQRFYESTWPKYQQEVQNWKDRKSDRIRIFPQWEGRDWYFVPPRVQ